MTRKLQGLLLDEAGISFHYSSPQKATDIVRDIQTIHDPSLSAGVLRKARNKKPGWLKLTAEIHDSACAVFMGYVGNFEDASKVSIWMPDLHAPGQTMGWAALQLYGELLTGRPLIDTLNFIDTMPKTAEKTQPTYESATPEISGHRTLGTVPEPAVGLRFSPHAPHTQKGRLISVTRGTFVSRHQHSLPGVLHLIQEGYDELYPGANTSEAVASLVSAHNLEDFTETWRLAADRYSDKPILAARMLLESDVFNA